MHRQPPRRNRPVTRQTQTTQPSARERGARARCSGAPHGALAIERVSLAGRQRSPPASPEWRGVAASRAAGCDPHGSALGLDAALVVEPPNRCKAQSASSPGCNPPRGPGIRPPGRLPNRLRGPRPPLAFSRWHMPTQRPGLRTPIIGKIIWVRVDTSACGETTKSKKPATTNGLLKASGAFGAHGGNRTRDLSLTKGVLYH